MIWFLRNLLALTALLAPVTGSCTDMAQAKEAVDISAPAIHGLARLRVRDSSVEDLLWDGVRINLKLSQGVPYRVYFLQDPLRMEVEFNALYPINIDGYEFNKSREIKQVTYFESPSQHSTLRFDLTSPMRLETADLSVNTSDGSAALNLVLTPVTMAEFSLFALQKGANSEPELALKSAETMPALPENRLTVLIDPGHGGIDPGAIVGDVNEAGLMLSLAKELKESLLRVEGVDVVLSRLEDKFVPLEARVSLAQAVKADLIISLHADALVEGTARGTTVYTLPARASESASQSLVLRHEPDSVLQGVDLNAVDEDVAMALLDLSRLENMQSSEILAESVVSGLSRVLGGLNSKPLRKAGFSVLKGADIPAILIEAGFMSTETDLENLQNAEWRAKFAEGVRLGVMIWYAQEKQIAPLRRR